MKVTHCILLLQNYYLMPFMQETTRKTNVGQSDVNLSMLALPYSIIPLMYDDFYCLPCGGWALVCVYKKYIVFYIHLHTFYATRSGRIKTRFKCCCVVKGACHDKLH